MKVDSMVLDIMCGEPGEVRKMMMIISTAIILAAIKC